MSNENIKGLRWEEKSGIPNNNIITGLEEYCNKYNVQIYGRTLNFEFVLELIEKVENGKKQQVDHPSHYNTEGRKECIVEMLEKYGFIATAHFALLNSYKYLYRMGLKDGNPSENDLKKAQWYFDWVDNKAEELKEYDVYNWELYWDICKGLQDAKQLPWVEVK